MTTERRGPFTLLGIGAAACVACCIGPIVALLGSIGVIGALSTPFVGPVALAIAALALTAAIALRRRRGSTCSTPADAVPVVLRTGERDRAGG